MIQCLTHCYHRTHLRPRQWEQPPAVRCHPRTIIKSQTILLNLHFIQSVDKNRSSRHNRIPRKRVDGNHPSRHNHMKNRSPRALTPTLTPHSLSTIARSRSVTYHQVSSTAVASPEPANKVLTKIYSPPQSNKTHQQIGATHPTRYKPSIRRHDSLSPHTFNIFTQTTAIILRAETTPITDTIHKAGGHGCRRTPVRPGRQTAKVLTSFPDKYCAHSRAASTHQATTPTVYNSFIVPEDIAHGIPTSMASLNGYF